MLVGAVPARARRIRRWLAARCRCHEVAFLREEAGRRASRPTGWLPGGGFAPVAAHDVTQLGDPRGSRGGHDQRARDGGEQQRHGERQVQVGAKEGDADRMRVLDDEDQHHDEDRDARNERDAHAADPGAHPPAAGRGPVRLRRRRGTID